MVLLQGMLCSGAAQPKAHPYDHAESAKCESREQTAHFAPGQRETGQEEMVVTMTLLMKPGLRMMVLGFRLVLTMYRSRDMCLKSYACMNSLPRMQHPPWLAAVHRGKHAVHAPADTAKHCLSKPTRET